MEFISLLLTLFVGFFIIIGFACSIYFKNNKKLPDFSVSMSFGVMVGLIILDILPETYETLNESIGPFRGIIAIIILSLIGIVILKILDLFVPCHQHDDHHGHTHNNDKCHREHLHHIGIVSAIAIVIHNLIEGMSLYLVSKGSLASGLLLCVGIGLHNIPMGLVITSTLLSTNFSKRKILHINILISLSTFLGGFIMFILGGVSKMVEGIFLGITLGMLIYIAIFELLHQIYHMKYKKIAKVGITIGLLLLIISFIIGYFVGE